MAGGTEELPVLTARLIDPTISAKQGSL